MILRKKTGLLLLLCALLCVSLRVASADEPVKEPIKQEQTAPAVKQEQTAPAAQPSPTPPPPEFPFHSETTPPQGPPSYEGAFVKMIVTVVGLVCFVLLTIWALRKIGQGRFRGFGSNRSIQVIEKKPLSPKSMLYLVEVGHQKFLIAESQLEIRRLGTIEDLSETAVDETS